MEHRKRYMMQQKVELPTLLRIVIANEKNKKFLSNQPDSKSLVKALAIEAIESLNNSDHTPLHDQVIFK